MLPEPNITPGARPTVFYSVYGLRSGWRILLFVALFLGITIPIMMPIRNLSRSYGRPIERLLLIEAVSTACILLATWIVSRYIERKPLTAFGLCPSLAGRKLGIGLLCGFVSLSLLVATLTLLGGEKLAGVSLHGAAILHYGALWALVFLLVAMNEELTTRGYLLFALTQAVGFWPAALILSTLFAAGHLNNPGEQWIGIAGAGLIGLALSWTVRWTGSLWWAIGYHAAWDWAETYFFGVPDSGTVAQGHLLSSVSHGASWLSGGPAGPEGSVFVIPVVALLVLFVWRAFASTPPKELDRLR